MDPGTKLPVIARRQGRQIGLAGGRRVELLFAEQDVAGADHDILHDDLLIAFELGIRGQRGRIDGQHLLPVNRNRLPRPALAPFAWLAPFPFRGVLGGGRLGTVGLNGEARISVGSTGQEWEDLPLLPVPIPAAIEHQRAQGS